MEEIYLSEKEKTEHEYEGEKSEERKNKEGNQSLNLPKHLEKEENINKINENNEFQKEKEKGSIKTEEIKDKNKIMEEDENSKDDIKDYDGVGDDDDYDDYDIPPYSKEDDRLSTKARKGSGNDRNIFSYGFFNTLTTTITFKDKYIIDLTDKLAPNVFRGKNMENNKELIFKFAKMNQPYLLNEAEILIELYNIERVPKIVTIGSSGPYYILAMNYIGPSLQDCLEKCDGKFTLGTTLKISIQILNIVKQIHEKGVALRYLKPENMLIGIGENKDFVYIIDFDLAKKIIINNEHIKNGKEEHCLGNKNFISINLHNYIIPTRRDDIESLGYNLIYFMKGVFPWKHCDHNATKNKKINIPVDELCSGLPDEFKEFIIYARKLEFSEKPNYEYLNNLLLKAAEKNNIDINSVKYDWEVKNEKLEKIFNEMKLRDNSSNTLGTNSQEKYNDEVNKNNKDEEKKKVDEFEKCENDVKENTKNENENVDLVKEEKEEHGKNENNKISGNKNNEENVKKDKKVKNKLKNNQKVYRSISYILIFIFIYILFFSKIRHLF